MIPTNYASRPVVLLGAGVLGRRIACVFVAGGYTVHIRDPSVQALAEAGAFIEARRAEFAALTKTNPSGASCGSYHTFAEIQPAVAGAWLVVEAVPEKLPLKIATLAEVDTHAPADCIVVSNSSSFKSRLMLDEVRPARRRRVANMHFTMPPDIRTVELMTDGETAPELFPFLTRVLDECGMVPVTARRESTGFIFNRLWAAVKREILLILAQGVSSAEEIDLLWQNMFQTPSSLPPCRLMDQIGLDTVALIEDNYVQERGLDGTLTVDWLREQYIRQGRLGRKSVRGGLYGAETRSASPSTTTTTTTTTDATDATDATDDGIYLLDVGLGANNADLGQIPTAGRILRLDPSTKTTTTLVSGQALPDGIDVSRAAGRLFWTNMGAATSTHDGSVHSARLDGSDVQTLLRAGTVHTPKQLVVDEAAARVYFCDREGMSLHRAGFDGAHHEVLVRTGSPADPAHSRDMTRWCVGIALDPARGHVYWTQKGPSKSGQGRIFRAGLDIPAGQTAETRRDIELVLDRLPEPIDLELDAAEQTLYWTDRGEHPTGCSLNKVDVGGGAVLQTEELRARMVILARQFHEPIGLKLQRDKKVVYVADLGGGVYQVSAVTGKKTLLFRDDASYTGKMLVVPEGAHRRHVHDRVDVAGERREEHFPRPSQGLERSPPCTIILGDETARRPIVTCLCSGAVDHRWRLFFKHSTMLIVSACMDRK
ncbi:YWTD domain-containing protein [Trichocladium antarcticum]|uniref:YWTD domain-containing protein n=1 Tax=Trichocladium antarcticum TaxID=1450529 RepID=A0AAN6UFP4_9PEZI|nr:YWTD domain-containing protein [Trichocladium antarcticum]